MRRILFVDVLRLLALFQMINGHTLDAVLADTERVGPGFEHYRFVRGLVSVAFLVVAGISFHLTTVARFEQHRQNPKAVKRRLWRALEIVLVGYLLQLRWPAQYFDPLTSAQALRTSFRCEVLQCIGLSLLVLELITLRARNARQVVVASALAATAIFALAPWGELNSLSGPPTLWRGLSGHGQGSQFPLLPWSGYVFSGVLIGAVALPQSGATPVARRMLSLVASAVALFGLAELLRLGPQPALLRASSSPWFVVQKLAVITLLLAVLAWLTRNLRSLPQMLTLLGAETLFIFVFHLQVIYGGSWALAAHFPRTLSLPEALLASAFNLALSVSFAFGWRALKQAAGKHHFSSRLRDLPAHRSSRLPPHPDWEHCSG